MATYQIPAPEQMNCSGDLPTNWKIFREAYEDYLVATGLDEKDKKIQVATLKSLMGAECKKILKRLQLTDDDMKEPAIILGALQDHFVPVRNILYERYIFHNTEQQAHETIDQYLIKLRQLAEPCQFGALEDEMVRDRLVLGCRDSAARTRLFREKSCDLKKAVESLRISETTSEQLKKIEGDGDKGQEPVNFVEKEGPKKKRPERSIKRSKSTAGRHLKQERECIYCGGQHVYDKNKCPAFGKTCRKCGKLNHFQSVCLQKQSVHYVQEDSASEDESVYYVESVGAVEHQQSKRFFVPLRFFDEYGEALVRCQLDTGATCNVMSFDRLCEIKQSGNPVMQLTTAKLRLYDESLVQALGECNLECKYKGKQHLLNFKIVPGSQQPLLSGETCTNMGLITVHAANSVDIPPSAAAAVPQDILTEYKDVFEGLGCLPGEYHLEVDPNITPVKHTPRRVAIPLKAELKVHIEELERMQVLKKVTEPTDWISSEVVVRKGNKLRLCIDPKDLNKALKRSHYPMPTIEEILPELSKAKVFSVADARNGFWQVKLDAPSSYLTTFWTPFGRYRWLRMPFGIATAPEEYQRRQHEALEGLPGIYVIADDILITGQGETREEALQDHDHNLIALLKRAREVNLKLNPKKLKLRLPEVPYIGHLLTSSGVKPDPEKVRAVQEMPNPDGRTNAEKVKAVQRFLGFVNYLAKFVPHLADECEPLRRLTDKEADWVWEKHHQDAFDRVKQLVADYPVLRYYDVNLPVTIQCDSSETGLGAALLQDGQPVAFASRTLTPTERGYAQIEKECLAIVFACMRFNQYIFGRKSVSVQSDHKPLETIFKKPLTAAPKRLQGMLLRLQKFNLEVGYKKGAEMFLADTLSRAPLPSTGPPATCLRPEHEEICRLDLEDVNAAEFLRVSNDGLKNIQRLTEADNQLQRLKMTVLQGWPETKQQLEPLIAEYWTYRDEIGAYNGVLYKGDRVIIPNALRKEMLKRIHASHQGQQASLRRAKDALFWPGMSHQIVEMVSNCSLCAEYQPAQPKEPLITPELPTRPWSIVAQDLYSHGGNNYLITVDAFSGYWEVDEMPQTTSLAVIHKTKQHFARFGIPDRVYTDNGPQFDCAEYTRFANHWQFEHLTSSPYHSQSNGLVEAAVKTAKTLQRKAAKANQDQWLSFLDYRNTPTEGMDSSPVQRLMSKRTKTRLPIAQHLLEPEIQSDVERRRTKKRRMAKKYFDRGSKELPELEIGQPIRLMPSPSDTSRKWRRGVCTKKVAPRSYLVEVDGSLYRRNRKFLRCAQDSVSESAQANPDAQSPEPQQEPPLSASLPPTPTNATTAPPVDHPAMSSGDSAPSEEEPPQNVLRNSSPSQPPVQRTRSGRIVKPPSRLNL